MMEVPRSVAMLKQKKDTVMMIVMTSARRPRKKHQPRVAAPSVAAARVSSG